MESKDPSTSSNSVDSTRIYMDSCLGVLSEVPSSFDLGTLKVKLCSISLSERFISLGSECGALFLFDRRLGRALKPLRTTFNEVVTCQKWYARNDEEQLAIGHRSGNLIVLGLPSTKKDGNKKLQQTIQEEIHKNCAVSALEFSETGQLLYSADISGSIMGLWIDFDNDTFTPLFIQNNNNHIRFLSLNPQLQCLITCEERHFELLTLGSEIKKGHRQELQNKITGINVNNSILMLMLSSGVVIEFCLEKMMITKKFDLKANLLESELLPEIYISGEQRDSVSASWTKADWKFASTLFYPHGRVIQFSQHKLQLIDIQNPDQPVQMLVIDIAAQLSHIKDIEIISVDFDAISEQIFVLTNTQHLLVIGFNSPDISLIKNPASQLSLFSSFNSYANQSSKKWFKKFSTDFQQITAPPIPLSLPLNSFNLEDQKNKLTTNLTQVLGQIEKTTLSVLSPGVSQFPEEFIIKEDVKVSYDNDGVNLNKTDSEAVTEENEVEDKKNVNSSGDVNFDGEAGIYDDSKKSENEESKSNFESTSSFSETSEPKTQIQEPKVQVIRKIMMKPKTEVNVESYKIENNIYTNHLEEEHNIPMVESVPSMDPMNLSAILGVLEKSNEESAASINLPQWTPTVHGYGDDFIDETEQYHKYLEEQRRIAEVAEQTIDFIKEEIASNDEDNTSLHGNVDEMIEDDSEDNLQIKAEVSEEAEDEIDSSFTSDFVSNASSIISSTPSLHDDLNAEYPMITRMANQRTDVWNRMKLPFTASDFDVNQTFIVVCSSKNRQKPYYRLFDTMENAMLGAEWTQLSYKAGLVALNDEASLLWRVTDCVAWSPTKVDSLSPSSRHWIEQANEGKIHAVSLTSSSAWYLTDKGPFIQMQLPDMGILFHAESPFELSQISATDKAVWALRAKTNTLVVRVGLKHCPMGTDWVEDTLAGPSQFASICLYDTTALGLDMNGELWMCNGVDEHRPFGIGNWYQVCSPTCLMPPAQTKAFSSSDKWQIKASTAGVFINVGKYILSARQPLTAHTLKPAVPRKLELHDTFGLISAGGFIGENNDYVFVGQPNSEIYGFSARKKNFTSLPLFNTHSSMQSTVVSITSARDRLFVLDSCGQVFVRDGINTQLNPRGNQWTELNTETLPPIISVATSSTTIWVVTSQYELFMSSLLSSPSEAKWKQATIPIDDKLNFDEVRCSPNGQYVWILATSSFRAWATCYRPKQSEHFYYEEIYWSETCADLKIIDIAVADNSVYALEAISNKVHRLRSVSTANPAGLYWKKLPIKARNISVDAFEQRLWALDMHNRLVRHEMQIFPKSSLTASLSESYHCPVSTSRKIEPMLFEVQSDSQKPSTSTLSSDWFDVETDKHDPEV